MMLGVAATGTPAAAPAPSFTGGLSLWTSPSTALQYLTAATSNIGAAFGSTLMPETLGVLAVPIAIVALISSAGKGGR